MRGVPEYNSALITADAKRKGWNPLMLSQRAGLSDMTVYRFLKGHTQTAKTAKAIATALRRSVVRYELAAPVVVQLPTLKRGAVQSRRPIHKRTQRVS